MNNWQQDIKDSLIPGVIGGTAACAMVALRGHHDTQSAIAPINATSHVIWGEEAAEVDEFSARHTLPGVIINLGAGFWWALVFQKLFGAKVDQGGLPMALAGGAATAAMAYVVDYHLVPKRLTPGWENRISPRSLYMSLGALAVGLGVGAVLTRKLMP